LPGDGLKTEGEGGSYMACCFLYSFFADPRNLISSLLDGALLMALTTDDQRAIWTQLSGAFHAIHQASDTYAK
jgi:hypothetical protein